MGIDKRFPVHGENGLRGTLLAPARFLDKASQKRIQLDDGREITVPAESLEPMADGSFYLRGMGGGPNGPASPAPPGTPPDNGHVQAVREDQPVYSLTGQGSEPFFRDDCEVRRVPVRRLIDRPVEQRQDGDTLIVPLMEEVLVLEKRLMLREELHITRRREQRPDTTPIRREELEDPA